MQTQQAKQLSELVCDHCGISFLEFRQAGLLGCPNDYEAFSAPWCRCWSGPTKAPASTSARCPPAPAATSSGRASCCGFAADLKEAVLHEDYERAARIRDQIKELEKP